jgi:DNA-binding GntR family transcriptional regulator
LLLSFSGSFFRRQACKMLSRKLRVFEIKRARMRLFFRDTDFRQELNQDFRLHFEFARQLVNSNLIRICHQPLFAPKLVRTRRFLSFTF